MSRCEEKRRYRSADQALRAALWQSRKNSGHPFRYYRCPFCHGWHTTSKPQQRVKVRNP